MSQEKYFEKAIDWAGKQGIKRIKANIKGFEQPASFIRTDGEIPFTPDVTGNKSGSKFYIEIATKTENIQRRVSKWKLLCAAARLKGGKLFLLAPKGHKAFAERLLRKHNLNNAQLIPMQNI